MKFKFIFFIIIVFILSCNSKDTIILVDDYYSIFNIGDEKEKNNIQRINLHEVSVETFFEYNKILISPLLYKLYLDEWQNFPGKLYIIDRLEENDNENHKNIYIDDSASYKNFTETINDNDNQNLTKISILIDYDTELKKNDVEILKTINDNIELDFLLITRSISRSKVSKFIRNNNNSDLWIIDSDKYGLYGYDLITNGSILLYNGENLQYGNSNIKYSIEVDFEDSYGKIFSDEIDFIYSKLKKY